MSSLRAPGPVDFALLLLLTTQWGTSYLAVKLAIGSVPEFTIVAARAALAGAFCYVIARYRHELLPTRRQDWLRFAFAGFFAGVVPFVLIGWASRRLDTGLVSIILATQPFWTMIFAHMLTRDEKIDARKTLGLAIGFAGIVWLIGFDALGGVGGDVWAQLACLGASASWSLANTVTRGVPGTISAAARGTALMIMAMAWAVPLALLLEAPWQIRPDWAAVGGIAMLGLWSTGAGLVVMMHLLTTVGVNFVSWTNYAIPLFAVFLGALLLDEAVSPRALVALALIMAGMAVTYGRRR